jgi:pimeloyl-ACP methyl ester carboxylesterase
MSSRLSRDSRPTVVRANGVDLCLEMFGDRESPAILLIAGAASSMDWWEDEFCKLLAAGPRFVIRYDHRDTGRSVSYEPGAPQYSGSDLVADAVAVLDVLEIARAHLVGISMGGGIAQRIALAHPERVASLTLMSTSPGDPDLPRMSTQLASYFAEPPPPPDWSDRAAVIEYLVDDLRHFEGALPFDEEGARALAATIVDRTFDIEASMTNHWILEDGESERAPLSEIRTPTLVLHGTEDPLFPIAHGEALAAAIPGARLLRLEGMGHQHPPRMLWEQVVAAILEHTAER